MKKRYIVKVPKDSIAGNLLLELLTSDSPLWKDVSEVKIVAFEDEHHIFQFNGTKDDLNTWITLLYDEYYYRFAKDAAVEMLANLIRKEMIN